MCQRVKDFDNLKIDDVEASTASENCDELLDDVFTKPLVLAKGELVCFDIVFDNLFYFDNVVCEIWMWIYVQSSFSFVILIVLLVLWV